MSSTAYPLEAKTEWAVQELGPKVNLPEGVTYKLQPVHSSPFCINKVLFHLPAVSGLTVIVFTPLRSHDRKTETARHTAETESSYILLKTQDCPTSITSEIN